jgi:hypothetical protein
MPLETLTHGEALIATAALAFAAVLASVTWIRRLASKTASDPWPREVDVEVRDPSAIPLCVNCTFPQEGHYWFCPYCGFPAGDFVTSMPYLYIFALGESMRRGVTGPPEKDAALSTFLTIIAACQYSVFAPLYWYWMFRKSRGKPICMTWRREPNLEKGA